MVILKPGIPQSAPQWLGHCYVCRCQVAIEESEGESSHVFGEDRRVPCPTPGCGRMIHVTRYVS